MISSMYYVKCLSCSRCQNVDDFLKERANTISACSKSKACLHYNPTDILTTMAFSFLPVSRV